MANPIHTIAYSGSIPQFYDSILGPLYFQPYAEFLGKKIASFQSGKILELACGTGRLTNEVIQRLPNAHVTATDINPSMLSRAQTTIASDKITWEIADATELNYAKESFDCVAAQFGVMFFGDKVSAYKQTRDVLASGGKFVFSTWNSLERNPVAAITQSVIASFFPVDTPPFYKFPFAYNDPKIIEADLQRAGFSNIQIELIALNGYASSASEAAKGLIEGTPAHTAIIERDPTAVNPLEKKLEEKLIEFFGEGEFYPSLEAYVVIAEK